jgi:voltage-gated potassium channel
MRKRIFEIVEMAKSGDAASNIYDTIMMLVIITSIIPLAFKSSNIIFFAIDKVAALIFAIDYVLRLLTADYKLNKGGASFAIYPFTPMAIVDLVAILPSFGVLSAGFRLAKLLRLLRALRVLRVFRTVKLFRYSKSVSIIADVIYEQKTPLLAVCTLAGAYIFISALVVFNVEPDTFNSFFDAIYWATVSLTTMGYGDIYPVTVAGKIVTIVSSFIGIAIVALPSGIITAGYMERVGREDKNDDDCE